MEKIRKIILNKLPTISLGFSLGLIVLLGCFSWQQTVLAKEFSKELFFAPIEQNERLIKENGSKLAMDSLRHG
jgi:hypothetical protein